MKKIVLLTSVAIFYVGILNDAKATITCTFTPIVYDIYALSVTGTGTGNTFDSSSCDGQLPEGISSWNNMKLQNIASVEFDNSITNIGRNTFSGAQSLTDVSMPNVRTIEESAFATMSNLRSVDMPNVERIADWAFSNDEISKLEYIGLSETAVIGYYNFSQSQYHTTIPLMSSCSTGDGHKVCTTCTSDQVYKPNIGCTSDCGNGYSAINGLCKKMPGCLNYADGACGGCERGFYKKEGGCVSSEEGCGSGYLEKDSVCISSANGCGAGYKDMGGFCNRIQYTPAEAAPLLNDDNNTVTITFKK